MVKIAVLDSQKQFADEIKEITETCMSAFGIEYELWVYWKIQNLFDDLKQKRYDIFLLETKMLESSEYETIYRIKKENIYSSVIYITSHVDYGPLAFESNPYRYIPQKQLGKRLPKAYKALHARIEKRKIEETQYQLIIGYSLKQISYQEIYYLKKERNYVWIFYKNEKSKIEKAFTEVSNELTSIDCFTRIGKMYIVNIVHVIFLKDHQVHLRDGHILSVNKRYWEQLGKDIMNYWKNHTY